MIKNDMGNWLMDNNEIKDYVVSFFSKLYTKEDATYKSYPISSPFSAIKESRM